MTCSDCGRRGCTNPTVNGWPLGWLQVAVFAVVSVLALIPVWMWTR